MVTIVDVQKRTKANPSKGKKKGEESFFVLILQGSLETVISKETGRPYLTARKTSIPCTFDEQYAKTLIGQQLPGEILKQEVDEYEYTIPGTDQVLKLSHSFQYDPEPVGMADEVIA